MTFIHGYLLGGLVLAGVPVLLHLILRQKPKRLPFPAFRFLLQKHRTNQVFASYESRNWSFGSATSALVMVSPKLYNTRAQYTGSALAAAAVPKHKHSSNPAYDVYDTRGWYIGSDPDATVRSMMALDPASTD